MLRPQSEAPRMGWRRALFQLSGGLINLGPGAAELRDRELIARVKAPVAGCRRIAVVSRKGGVGKRTTTLMLGHTFASYRGDRVIALDGNPDAGSLGYRVRRETTNTIMSLLAHRDEIARYADIRAYTSQAASRRLLSAREAGAMPPAGRGRAWCLAVMSLGSCTPAVFGAPAVPVGDVSG